MKRKIRKFRGGGADMGAPERAQERANRGYGSTAGVDRSAVGPGSKFAENTQTQNLSTNKKSNIPIIGPVTLGINLVKKMFEPKSYNKSKNLSGVVTHKNISVKNISANKKTSLPIIGPVSLGINLVQSFLNRPKKTKSPFSANTIKQTRKPPMQPRDRGNNIQPQLCPDGTPPPCKAKTVEPTKANKPNFLSGFRAYNSGGVSSGPPPKRGPNPQVPPIKMKSGKMNNMTCPHRPDGIRGMGAAIKGHKFIGVK